MDKQEESFLSRTMRHEQRTIYRNGAAHAWGILAMLPICLLLIILSGLAGAGKPRGR